MFIQTTGSYIGTSASITIDDKYPCSLLSSHFAHNENIARTVSVHEGKVREHTSGPLMIPSDGGWYHSLMSFDIEFRLQHDVVLGMDWIKECRPFMSDGMLARPSEDDVRKLPAGHTWIEKPSVTATQVGEKHDFAEELSNHCSTQKTYTTSRERRSIVDFIRECFFDPCSDLYVFTGDSLLLRNNLTSHGIASSHLSTEQCQEALLHHLLNGLCKTAAGKMCKDVKHSRNSVIKLALTILDAVLDSSEIENFSLVHLRSLCSAVGIIYSSTNRQTLMRQLNVRRDRLRYTPSESVANFLMDSIR